MKSLKSVLSVIISLCLVLPVLGCTANEKVTEPVLETATPIVSDDPATSSTTAAQTQENDGQYDTYVILNDANTTIDGEGVTFQNNVLTITAPGSYLIKGTLSDGHIAVKSPDTEKKVKLYFDSVNIHCTDTAPVYVEESGKETIIILADGSQNTLSDNADRAVPEGEDTEYATAVIYSKDDLQIEGGGTLTIEANFNKGIYSKDDLQIRGGVLNITSADDALRGKDSIEISGGTFNLNSRGDAIRTSNETDEDKGDILISAGTFSITSELDGIQAVSDLLISGGDFAITTGGGSGEIKTTNDRGFGSFPGARPSDSSAFEAESENSVSSKAIKGNSIVISGGTFTIDSLDDALHSGSSLTVKSGTFSVKSGDDGFHAETALEISGGSINILQSYEGLEGESIKIADGTVHVVSSDDGLNAASSSEQSENPNAPWGQENQTPQASATGLGFGNRPNKGGSGGGKGGGMGEYNSASVIEISGGTLTVNADGDGIDSNGDIRITGGEVCVFGPESNGNGALDYAGSCTVTGGTLLAAGSSGMNQSVSGGSVPCVNISCNVSGNTLFTILDENEQVIVSFVSPKSFSSVVFAGDSLDKNEKVSAYTGGTHSGEAANGIYGDGSYTKGTLLGQFTAG